MTLRRYFGSRYFLMWLTVAVSGFMATIIAMYVVTTTLEFSTLRTVALAVVAGFLLDACLDPLFETLLDAHRDARGLDDTDDADSAAEGVIE